MNITLTFRLKDRLPTEVEQLSDLWKVATLLAPLGLPVDDWYPPADTPEQSVANKAFNDDGPTRAAVAILAAEQQDKQSPGLRMFGVWNGREGTGAAGFDTSLSVVAGSPLSVFSLQSKRVPTLADQALVVPLLMGLLEIWSARSIEVRPYKYGSQKVFPKRPGAGWILYLPQVLSFKEIPEARQLIPVMDGKKQRGTLILSVIDEPFDANNPEHVRVANAIEMRLVDQDLLPHFADL